MQLTPTLKFLIVAYAFLINSLVLIWTGIQVNVSNLGLSVDWYNIGLTVLTSLNLGASALLIYLGLKAPTIGQHIVDGDPPSD